MQIERISGEAGDLMGERGDSLVVDLVVDGGEEGNEGGSFLGGDVELGGMQLLVVLVQLSLLKGHLTLNPKHDYTAERDNCSPAAPP